MNMQNEIYIFVKSIESSLIEIYNEFAFEVAGIYSDSEVRVSLEGGKLTVWPMENWKAAAVYLKGKDKDDS